MVSHAQLPHLLDVVKIAAIDDDRLLERALYPLEIRMAVLVPVRYYDQCVRAGERLIISLGIIYSVAEQTPGVVERSWIVRADRHSLLQQRLDQRQRRRLSHVVGSRLEGETPDRDAASAQLFPQGAADLRQENRLLTLVGRFHRR